MSFGQQLKIIAYSMRAMTDADVQQQRLVCSGIDKMEAELTALRETVKRLEGERNLVSEAFSEVVKTLGCDPDNEEALVAIDKLQRFKAFVHKRLDDGGVPGDPPGAHRDPGCRIGQRLDWLFARAEKLERELADERRAIVATRHELCDQRDRAEVERNAAIARAEKAERERDALHAIIQRTYKEWVGRDFGHLPLPEAIGKVRERIDAERDAALAEVGRMREVLNVANAFAMHVRERAGHPMMDVADNMVDAIGEVLYPRAPSTTDAAGKEAGG